MSAAPETAATRPRFSAAQHEAADPRRSVWVAASAGSGKTKVLTDRVLRLMLDGTPASRILCLTFTRAAAAEMAIRINSQLGEWTIADDPRLDGLLGDLTGAEVDDGLRARARRLFAAVLDTPGGLKIVTIHAFCQSLLGRFPIEAGLAPHFDVLDERSAAELALDAQDEMLEQARSGGDTALTAALAEVSERSDEATFIKLMDKLRGARGRLRRLIAGHHGLGGLIAATFRLLGVAPGATAAAIVADACADERIDFAALAATCEALAQGKKTDQARGEIIVRFLNENSTGRAAMFDAYYRIFFTAKGAPAADKSLATKQALDHDAMVLDILRVEQARLAEVVERRNAALIAVASAALLRLGEAMLSAYDRLKQARARLDYEDLVLRAAGLLEREGVAPWVLYKLDGGLDHILVDEAQDTSPEQWRVIARLADEFFSGEGAREARRTVFVVGDEKQSIFSFQGADLDELERMRAHFGERTRAALEDWAEVGLDLSFRSTPEVLRAVDAVFAQAAAREGVAFADHRIEHRPERRGHAGRVELWPVACPADDDPVAPWTPPLARRASDQPSARLAGRIAATIRRWLDGGEVLESRGRPIRAGDIMVLVRRRTVFVDELVRALKAAGIAVAGADRMVLSDQLAVMDLVALGEFLLLPDDDLTLACVLKGPLIGLDEEALFDLAHERDASLWRTLTRRRAERQDFAAAHRALAALLARADFVPPYELFADILAARGGRRKLTARLGPDANDPIDEFLALALDYERTGPPSLQGFLHWLATGEVRIKRDFDQGRDEVRVMTVHGAKGLEAPIVFLPDTTTVPVAPSPEILWYEGGEDGGEEALLWPVRAEFRERRCATAHDITRAREMQEYRRLLYVAMTRAEDRLYVCGWQGKREMPGDCWYRLIESGIEAVAAPFAFEAGATDGVWRGRGLRLAGQQTRPPKGETVATATAADPAPLPDFARRPPGPEPAPPRPLAPSRPAAAEPAPLSPLAAATDETRFRRGRLIHRLLQILPGRDPAARADACRRFLARPGHGLDPEQQAEIATEVLAILEAPEFAALFGPGSRAEVPLVGVVDGTVVAGQVDRLVVGDDEVVVVDYKTDRPPPADPAGVPAAYLGQMAAYRAVLSRIYPGKKISCALLWSDGPTLMRLAEADLAGGLAGRAP